MYIHSFDLSIYTLLIYMYMFTHLNLLLLCFKILILIFHMCNSTHDCVYTCIQRCEFIYIYVWVFTFTYIYTYIYIFIFAHVNLYIYIMHIARTLPVKFRNLRLNHFLTMGSVLFSRPYVTWSGPTSDLTIIYNELSHNGCHGVPEHWGI